MQNILVSIIIPIYNVEAYIVRCLDSVLHQTYRHLEVILVDDCTPDRSMQIAREHIEQSPQSKDLRFVYLKHDHNRGLSAARNTGIDAATGDYLFFLDSDDEIISDCLRWMVDCVINHPDSELICAGAKVTIGLDWFSFEKKCLPEYSDDINWINQALLQRSTLLMTAWNKLVRRSFVISNKLYFLEGVIHEDDIWNFDLSKRVSKLAVCKHDTYIYNLREGSIMSDMSHRNHNRMVLLKYFVNHITDPYRKRQVTFVHHFIKVHFPNGTPIELKKDMSSVVSKMISESRGKQRIALWAYYHIPFRFLYHLHVMNWITEAIGNV